MSEALKQIFQQKPKRITLFLSLILAVIFFSLFLKYNKNWIYPWKASMDEMVKISSVGNGFIDLDADNELERALFKNNMGYPAIAFYELNRDFIDVIKIPGKWMTPEAEFLLDDLDSDGYGEIYTITIRNDSILLNAYEPLGDEGHFLQNIFLDVCPKANGLNHIRTAMFFSYDTDSDGNKEILMLIMAGYSKSPRKIYRYDPVRKKLDKSPDWGAAFNRVDLLDINDDGKMEFIFGTTSLENFSDEDTILYKDTQSWILGLNHNLDSVIIEIEFPDHRRSISCIPKKVNGKNLIYAINYSFIQNNSILEIYDLEGNLISQRDSFHFRLDFLNTFFNELESPVLHKDFRNYYIYDNDFNHKRTIENLGNFMIYSSRRSYISEKNILFFHNKNEINITDSKFNLTGRLMIENSDPGMERNFYLIGNKDPNHFEYAVIDRDGNMNIISLSRNFIYNFRILIYSFLFVLFFLVSLLFFIIQNYFSERKVINQLKISSLQLQSIQNQLQPHFTFNVLNNIAALLKLGKNNAAYEYLVDFSGMLRTVLINTEKTHWKLKNELDFVKSYIKMENLRFNDKFNFELETEHKMLKEYYVPKLMLQSFVENSVKHGLVHKKEDCFLKIGVYEELKHIKLIVEDNGIGRKESSKIRNFGTRKGIKIIDEYIQSYNLFHQVHFSISVEDLCDKNSKPVGTRVKLLIPKNYG